MGVPASSIGGDEFGNLYAVGYADGKIYPLAIRTDFEYTSLAKASRSQERPVPGSRGDFLL